MLRQLTFSWEKRKTNDDWKVCYQSCSIHNSRCLSSKNNKASQHKNDQGKIELYKQFILYQNFIISILFHYNSVILELGHCFKYNWFVKTTISVTWTYLKNTYLCQCSHSNGVDQLVKKEDHLFPVANKWTKLESSSCKIFCKERNTTLDMKTWVTNNSVINCKNETVLTRIQKNSELYLPKDLTKNVPEKAPNSESTCWNPQHLMSRCPQTSQTANQ